VAKRPFSAYQKAFFDAFNQEGSPFSSEKQLKSVLSPGLFKNQCVIVQPIPDKSGSVTQRTKKSTFLESHHMDEISPLLFSDHRTSISFILPRIINLAVKDSTSWINSLIVETRAIKEENGLFRTYLVISKFFEDGKLLVSQYTRLDSYRGEAYRLNIIQTKDSTVKPNHLSITKIKEEYFESLPFTAHQRRVLKGYAKKRNPSELANEMNISTRTLEYHRKELLLEFKGHFRSEVAQSCKTINHVIGFLNKMGILDQN